MSQSTAAARVPARPIVRPASRERPQPRLRVVAPTPRRSAGGLALLSVGLLVLGLLVLLLLNISIGKGAYDLTELQRQQRQLAEDRQALAEQVEAASAPQRLAAEATKLGMVLNESMAVVKLPDGTVQGKAEVAKAPSKPADKTPETARKTVGALAAAAAAGKQAVAKRAAAEPTP
jgi:outer membrane murein-binding lipoprotein Lpp